MGECQRVNLVEEKRVSGKSHDYIFKDDLVDSLVYISIFVDVKYSVIG